MVGIALVMGCCGDGLGGTGGVVPVGAVVVPPPTVSARDGRATPTAPASAAAVFDEV